MLGNINKFFKATGTLIAIAIIVSYLVLAYYSRKQSVTGYALPDKGALEGYAPQIGTVARKLVIVVRVSNCWCDCFNSVGNYKKKKN